MVSAISNSPRQHFLKYLLLIAMVIGMFHNQLATRRLTPYLVSLMFHHHCRISWADIQLTRFHYILLAHIWR